MGNTKSVQNDPYTLHHCKFGKVKYYSLNVEEEKDNVERNQKMHWQTPIIQKKQFDKWKRQLSKINDPFGKEIFLAPETYEFENVYLCSDTGIAKIVYKYYEFDLVSEIDIRKHIRYPFTEPEIWFILYTLISCGYKFQKDNQTIGDVHPNNILFDRNDSLAIVTKYSVPKQKDNFEKIIEDKNAETFFAPQQIKPEYLSKCQYDQTIEKSLAQVFCVGLTILSLGTLQSCSNIYDRIPNWEINKYAYNYLINLFSNRYSPYLTSLLKKMLEISPQKRVRYKFILLSLIKYEKDILNVEFNPKSQSESPIGIWQNNLKNYTKLDQKLKMHWKNPANKIKFYLNLRSKLENFYSFQYDFKNGYVTD